MRVDEVIHWRRCLKCKVTKTSFGKQTRGREGLSGWCKDCFREARLSRRYGVTILQYKSMLKKQGGVCAICKRLPGKTPLHVDHCHTTGRVRGLLCFRCNSFLGMIEDVGNIQVFADYLDGEGTTKLEEWNK